MEFTLSCKVTVDQVEHGACSGGGQDHNVQADEILEE